MAGVFNALASLFRMGPNAADRDQQARQEQLQEQINEEARRHVMLRPRQSSSASEAIARDIAAMVTDAAGIQRNFWANPPHRYGAVVERDGRRVIWHGGAASVRRFQANWTDVPSTWLHKPPVQAAAPIRLLLKNVEDAKDPKSWAPLLEELTEEESIVLRVALDYVESKDGWKKP
jgi:hypothetical protein